jgi:mannose-6-phosphate isomerase-like protein (cupin superfamily)
MDIKEYILSGILEQYVLGTISKEEAIEVEQAAAKYPEVRKEIAEISKAIEQFAMANAVQPSRNLKPFVLATIEYMERMENGETPSFPPLLNETSKLSDFDTWLNREDMVLPAEVEDTYAKIIGYTPKQKTAIIWIMDSTPPELHHDEYEKFLIVEGTCNITIDENIYPLVPGDYFQIPLHKTHIVKVTSKTPCKVILQRIAA